MTFIRFIFLYVLIAPINLPPLYGSVENIDDQNEQSHYILPKHMMQQVIEKLSFPEVVILEQVNKSLYALCSQWVVYKFLTKNWDIDPDIVNKYHIDTPRRKFHHMLEHMPEFQVYMAELWQLHFPIGKIAPYSFSIPRPYYWPQAHGAKTLNSIVQLYDRALKSVSNNYCAVRGRALLGIHSIMRPPYEYPLNEIVNAHIFKLRRNTFGNIRKFADIAYPVNLRLRALILAQDIYDNNYAALIVKLIEAKERIFTAPKESAEDFQMELLRIHMCTLMGDMLFEGKGDINLERSLFYYEEVLGSKLLSPETYNHIGQRTLQIQMKNDSIKEKKFMEYMIKILEDPYTNLKDREEICALFPDA